MDPLRERAAARATPAPEGEQLGSRKPLSLLVDDGADTRELYAECLSHSFDIAGASTAKDALTKASELRRSAIVMDLVLPDMGGEDAIVSSRRDARTQQIPVVVLSGFTEPKQKSLLWNAYPMQPCHPDALSACLDRMIATRA